MDSKIIGVIVIIICGIVKLLFTGLLLAIGFRLGNLINIKIDQAYNKSKSKDKLQASAVAQPTVA